MIHPWTGSCLQWRLRRSQGHRVLMLAQPWAALELAGLGKPQGTGSAGGGNAKGTTNRMEVSAGVRVGFGSRSASCGACGAPRGERGLWVPSSPREGAEGVDGDAV